MDIKEMIELLKNKAEDPSTQILDLRNIAVAALDTLAEAADNLEQAVDSELEEDDPVISSDIAHAVEDAVQYGSSDLSQIAEKLR